MFMRNKRNERGFTLIEIMVVVVILGILATIIVPKIMSRPDQARLVKAKQDILAIESALELYKLDNGIYPTGAQGLQALIKRPQSSPLPANWQAYLKRLPKDPWGYAYHYQNPGQHSEIDIFTYGAKHRSGGANAIIGNWQEDETRLNA